jgi:hypothetical protein
MTAPPSTDDLIKIVEPPPPKVQLAETVQVDPPMVGSILDLKANPEPAPAPQAAAQTVQDTGEPEESDAALDARINGLLKI